MKANQDKCHFLSNLDINEKFSLHACIIENSSSQKVLGVAIGRELNFNEHASNLCIRISRKNQTFARNSPYAKTTFNECLFFV